MEKWLKILKIIFIHLVFWLLVVVYFAWVFGLDIEPKRSFINELFYLSGYLIMVYTLLYFLVPRFLLKRKFWQFFLGFIIVVIPLTLVKEIELLQNYISLEQLRYGERLDMSMSVTGEIIKYQIAPMLLLPFLENAFKHSISRQIDQCWISFNLSVDDSIMTFKLINSIEPNLDEVSLKVGGMGLQNVIRRPQLLYKDRYRIETVKMEEVFVVDLELTLETLQEEFIDFQLT